MCRTPSCCMPMLFKALHWFQITPGLIRKLPPSIFSDTIHMGIFWGFASNIYFTSYCIFSESEANKPTAYPLYYNIENGSVNQLSDVAGIIQINIWNTIQQNGCSCRTINHLFWRRNIYVASISQQSNASISQASGEQWRKMPNHPDGSIHERKKQARESLLPAYNTNIISENYWIDSTAGRTMFDDFRSALKIPKNGWKYSIGMVKVTTNLLFYGSTGRSVAQSRNPKPMLLDINKRDMYNRSTALFHQCE